MRLSPRPFVLAFLLVFSGFVRADTTNFEASHVHPIALTPSGLRLLAVNTPDATLEVFTLDASGRPVPSASIPVGLEPVTVVARTDNEAWVVNQLSDSISIVDLALGTTVRTLRPGNEPMDVVFAAGKAFVAVSHEDAVKVYDLANLAAAPSVVPLFASHIRALAVSAGGAKVYAVAQDSGNETAVVDASIIFGNDAHFNPGRLTDLGLSNMQCSSSPPPYPPLPGGVTRNPALIDPPDGVPKVGLIVKWDRATSRWLDEAGQNWTACLPFRLPDHDLFVINTATLAVTPVDHLGTTLFDVSVQPGTGKVFVPHTEARNAVRFEHALGVRGHVVDNRMAVVDPASVNAVTLVDLNGHINRASNPASNAAERNASISQPGMMVWKSDGSTAYLTAIGSRKLFALSGVCVTPGCVFGPDRASPAAVEVGEGPTGVALLEARSRLYVLNRISSSIAIVDAATLTKVGEVALHDPLPPLIRAGRRFLYDAILSSGHGDAACSTCHISGDKDGLAWDLGDPTGTLAPYSTPSDNVRFVAPNNNQPVACDLPQCASHQGFDPQKGPMTTQTLRGMLEPLHWRGDRATMNDFNPAFVGLLGSADIGPVNGKPAGLSAVDMETFRQFSLGMRFPPNPYRNVNDSLPNANVLVPGTNFTGNPFNGQIVFTATPSDAGQPCSSCHSMPFGTAGGKLGGVTPTNPTSTDAAALFNGNLDQSLHSDLKIPHLRNLWDKTGFVFGPAGGPYPDVRTSFGLVHDGAIPNLPTFFSFSVFTLNETQVRDVSSFMLYFPTGTKPSVGQSLTVPAGVPPTGSPAEESLLTTLISVGDLASAARHCELTASARLGGVERSFRFSGGTWLSDIAGDPPRTTAALRQSADAPLTFLCVPLGSGPRLGGDRDEDAVLNGNDCAPADPLAWAPPSEVGALTMGASIGWASQAASTGSGIRYEVAGGLLSSLRASGLAAATSCVSGSLTSPSYTDARPAPSMGDGFYYLVRAVNSCASSGFGPGRAVLDPLSCSP